MVTCLSPLLLSHCRSHDHRLPSCPEDSQANAMGLSPLSNHNPVLLGTEVSAPLPSGYHSSFPQPILRNYLPLAPSQALGVECGRGLI